MRPFLTADWRNLLMINFEADPAVLKAYVPAHTELDTWNNTTYISLIGFLFQDTRVKGFSFPGHRTFEEVNLRFYVRYKQAGEWKRGVVFIKELVPKALITFVANTLYGEKYATHIMTHSWENPDEATLKVAYRWKVKNEWNHLSATAMQARQPIIAGSEEQFITDHYWGYTRLDHQITGEYQVTHPQWDIHPVTGFDYHCSTRLLYGAAFENMLQQTPTSALLAAGSGITVMPGKKIRNSTL
ncbi:YqjF family protein [Chitinophaga sp. ARDCPP14]|uniref:YqjF family protein n=1 Tax=Chitinophaga sp. ARDCPP14 TaxID=3391139 RepID=UPI003F51C9FB